jgi:hypothetical protein
MFSIFGFAKLEVGELFRLLRVEFSQGTVAQKDAAEE